MDRINSNEDSTLEDIKPLQPVERAIAGLDGVMIDEAQVAQAWALVAIAQELRDISETLQDANTRENILHMGQP